MIETGFNIENNTFIINGEGNYISLLLKEKKMNQNNTTILVLTVFSLLGLLAGQSCAAAIIVDDDGPADFNSIQAAIDSITVYGTIEVKPGTYYENISYYGKTIVITSTDPNDPNVVEATIIDGNSLGNVVTFNNGEDENCILAGFTIQNGESGIYCYLSGPIIQKCVIRGNTTGVLGPGSPGILQSTVTENTTTGINDCDGDIADCNISANLGTGLAYCDSIVTDCNISENGSHGLASCGGQTLKCTVVGNTGSGFSGCGGTIERCIISANGGDGYIGAESELINCLVSANGGNGMKLGSISTSQNTVVNCTIVGNMGDGIRAQGGFSAWAYVNSINNIIVKNAGIGLNEASLAEITSSYSNIWQNLQGNYGGVVTSDSDISQNPVFAVAGYWDMSNNWVEGEYHLMSAAGRWDVNDWVYDDFNSPSIDAGDPCSLIGVEPNPNGGIINQGVYGGTAQASKSPSGVVEPVCTELPAMDYNQDCKVDFADLAVFCLSWLECNLDPPEACWE